MSYLRKLCTIWITIIHWFSISFQVILRMRMILRIETRFVWSPWMGMSYDGRIRFETGTFGWYVKWSCREIIYKNQYLKIEFLEYGIIGSTKREIVCYAINYSKLPIKRNHGTTVERCRDASSYLKKIKKKRFFDTLCTWKVK